MILTNLKYNEIVSTISEFKGLSRDCEKMVYDKYPEIPKNTLGSIISTEYQRRMRKNHIKSEIVSKRYYENYMKGISIIEIAKSAEVTPALVAKMILERHYKPTDDKTNSTRQIISSLLKDTTKIDDPYLAYDVHEAVLFDNQYGPISDAIKQSIGEEYEQLLKYEAKKMDLCFKDENELRQSGFDKTPDLKLEIPIAVDGVVVNWIESKALFGDKETHKGYVKDQLHSYWNRFGPGLVIYWFGYHEDIINSDESVMFIVRDYFPKDEIKCMEL